MSLGSEPRLQQAPPAYTPAVPGSPRQTTWQRRFELGLRLAAPLLDLLLLAGDRLSRALEPAERGS